MIVPLAVLAAAWWPAEILTQTRSTFGFRIRKTSVCPRTGWACRDEPQVSAARFRTRERVRFVGNAAARGQHLLKFVTEFLGVLFDLPIQLRFLFDMGVLR